MRKVLIYLVFSTLLIQCQKSGEPVNLDEISPEEDFIVNIETSYGTMKAILYDETPKHKQNFLKLANEGFYTDLLFHRIIKGFMLQGGDPDSRNAGKDDILGRGDPGYTIPAEFNEKLFHKKGALSAARMNDQVNPKKESNGSQFFIVQGQKYTEEELASTAIDYRKLYTYFDSAMRSNEFNEMKSRFASLQTEGSKEDIRNFIVGAKDTLESVYSVELDNPMPQERIEVYTTIGGYPSLDGAYTVFGQVIDGLDVIDVLSAKETGKGDRPLEDLKMKVSLEVMKRKEIEEQFDFKYSSK
ncbi:peptidylprolyl isomerase [Chondrinema litorale]|uniref:peptidylprolyl isomerase n=1 Tax=Chondrinema litorale TaxID=2994555 RepID=UPI0025437008|nr:peptidylprolyl isomerase [Chondrinema litorale]UZR95417.1 peptidylprolyl isomerase [Chondrinema litorale]